MIQVNDKLCCDTRDGVYFSRVESITPSGRIKLVNGTILNPNLSIRGAGTWGPFYYRIPSNDDFRAAIRRINENELNRAYRLSRKLTYEQLQKIADCIREVTKEPTE